MTSPPFGETARVSSAAVGGIGRLAEILGAAAGVDAVGEAGPTTRELAELLWLARKLASPGEERQSGTGAGRPRPGARTPTPAPAPAPTAVAPNPTPPRSPRPSPPPTPDGRVPLHLAATPPRAPHDDPPGTPLLAPAPPMLHHPLALQRALRPLKRKVPSPRARVLDEHATADRIARLGARPDAWLPVLRPAPDRWLRLNLVYDTGPTMPVWRPLVRELHTTLAQSGIFRAITPHPAGPDGRARQVPDPSDGRTVTLIVSDCMGPQWRPGPAGTRWYRTLHHWASRMPVAVLQPLPEHLWSTTALPAEPGLLAAPSAAAPATRLTFTPYDPDAPTAHTVLQVLEPGPSWLANWATLIASPGGAHTPGAAAPLPTVPTPPPEPSAPDIASLPPHDLVIHFRSTASPEAFRLAGHLALADPSLPVMRLVQRALEPSPRPQHLAEIILSGMLTAVPGPPGSYDFRPGVRDLLLRSLPRTARGRTREFLARVGGLIDERAGIGAGEIPTEVRGGEEGAIATVREETVRRLGGRVGGGSASPAAGQPRPIGPDASSAPSERRSREAGSNTPSELLGERYRLVRPRGRGRRVWQAVDVRSDRPVVVHLYREQADAGARFLGEAETLAGLRHPNVIPVLDWGVEGETPYLVAEFVDGVTLAELEQGSGPGVSCGVLARLVLHVTKGLDVLHRWGLVRGQRGSNGLLLKPDGTAVIDRFALGEESGDWDAAADFRELSTLLRYLTSHTEIPDEHRTLFRRVAVDLGAEVESVRRTALDRIPREVGAVLESGGVPSLRFTMLGPLEIALGDEPVLVPVSEAQALLCMLVLKQGCRVTYSELAQGMWDDPPTDAEAVRRIDLLCTEVLRRLGPGTLAAVTDGYALHIPGAFVDVFRCEELLSSRAHPVRTPNPGTRRARTYTALSLWHGDPLDGVPGPAAEATRARLRALHLTLRTNVAELDLELGDFERAVADLTVLLQEHPDREDFHRLHTLALQGMTQITAESPESHPEEPDRPRPTIVFEAPGLNEHDQARHTLGRAVTGLLSGGDLAPHQYEVLARTDGYVVLTEPEADVLPVLSAVLHELPDALADLTEPPPFRVTFWHAPWFANPDQPALSPDVQLILEGADADVLVVVSPALYEEFGDHGSLFDATAFQPLRLGAATTPPVAWYCPLHLPPTEPEYLDPDPGDLIRGPYTTPDLARLETPDPATTAIVHTQPDGPLTLLNPAHPWGRRPPRLTTYYEVDLTTHHANYEVALPSSGGGAFTAFLELSWHADDPVAYVRDAPPDIPSRFLDHFLKEGARITRRHPLRRAGSAQQALHEGLRRWPVAGLSVSYSVLLVPQGGGPAPTPQQSAFSVSPLTLLLRGAETVLIGFDGPLTRLFPKATARTAALDLLSLVVEDRDPSDALAGRSLTGTGQDGPLPLREGLVHPLDVLRAFARHPVAPRLRARLDELELQAAARAAPTEHATALLYALRESGRRVVVVTDCSPEAVHRFLDRRKMPVDSVHGRKERLDLLMPDPDPLLRALRSPGTPSRVGLLISSSNAELQAAEGLGLRRIGYTKDADLRTTAADLTVSSLEALLDATRSL
ncbi:SAV_2336 N-terminal domain-related protein [Streptomyces sp. NPDC047081]|uniref:SAV_2336 N-terminal domain-related protein n=1 Tax=Streptomyces sp. NPDC047081 TaxID=3154706 RepID=UPI0033C90207